MDRSRERRIRQLRDEWRHLAQNKHRGGWVDSQDSIYISDNAQSYFAQLNALEEATGALLSQIACESGGMRVLLKRLWNRDIGDDTNLKDAQNPAQLYIRTLKALLFRRSPESGDALLSRLYCSLDLLPEPQYSKDLRGNTISDPTSILSAGEIVTRVFGQVSGARAIETAKHRVREWMRSGTLPANRTRRGRYVVSKIALEQLATIHRSK